ncbi:hypothetical protein EV1_004558 [Malus domestica]
MLVRKTPYQPSTIAVSSFISLYTQTTNLFMSSLCHHISQLYVEAVKVWPGFNPPPLVFCLYVLDIDRRWGGKREKEYLGGGVRDVQE